MAEDIRDEHLHLLSQRSSLGKESWISSFHVAADIGNGRIIPFVDITEVIIPGRSEGWVIWSATGKGREKDNRVVGSHVGR